MHHAKEIIFFLIVLSTPSCLKPSMFNPLNWFRSNRAESLSAAQEEALNIAEAKRRTALAEASIARSNKILEFYRCRKALSDCFGREDSDCKKEAYELARAGGAREANSLIRLAQAYGKPTGPLLPVDEASELSREDINGPEESSSVPSHIAPSAARLLQPREPYHPPEDRQARTQRTMDSLMKNMQIMKERREARLRESQ